jgi:hypothetical protein
MLKGQRYRVAIAVTFVGCAIAFFVADPRFNVQNVVMGFAALIASIAALPRGHASSDSPAAKPNVARHL